MEIDVTWLNLRLWESTQSPWACVEAILADPAG